MGFVPLSIIKEWLGTRGRHEKHRTYSGDSILQSHPDPVSSPTCQLMMSKLPEAFCWQSKSGDLGTSPRLQSYGTKARRRHHTNPMECQPKNLTDYLFYGKWLREGNAHLVSLGAAKSQGYSLPALKGLLLNTTLDNWLQDRAQGDFENDSSRMHAQITLRSCVYALKHSPEVGQKRNHLSIGWEFLLSAFRMRTTRAVPTKLFVLLLFYLFFYVVTIWPWNWWRSFL